MNIILQQKLQMRNLLIVTLCVAGASACSAKETGATLATQCNQFIINDERMVEVLVPEGFSTSQLCSCYDKMATHDKTINTQQHMDILTAIIDIQTELSLDAENAAKEVATRIETNSNAYPFTAEELDTMGSYITDVSFEMAVQKKCPV